jgi:hypothetical protein
MKRLATIGELQRALRQVKTGVAGDTIFGAKALLFLCEQVASLAAKNGTKRSRKKSSWQLFFGKYSKLGLPAKEIATEWRKQIGGLPRR